MTTARNRVLENLCAPDWNPRSESHGMSHDDATALLDSHAVEIAAAERAATYRAAADLIADNVTCGCSVCRERKDIAAVLRGKADEIHPT